MTPGFRSPSDRREFLSALTTSLAAVALPVRSVHSSDAPHVEAETTIFFAHPDGHSNLVRFYVRGLEAPAGRMRVFGPRRRLLATAGVVQSGDHLYGELWLPLDAETTIVSELEAPGLRGPLRTAHTLRPRTRWTIAWLATADPWIAREDLMRLPPLNRGIQSSIWRNGGMFGNPLPAVGRLRAMDHIEFLRMGVEARDLEWDFRIPPSTVAYTSHLDGLPHSVIVALTGMGVRCLLHRDQGREPLEWWRGQDGSQVLAARVLPGGDPQSLGFAEGIGSMTARIEQWLFRHEEVRSSGPAVGTMAGTPALAFLMDEHPSHTILLTRAAIDEWNRRFAYPRIVIGVPGDAAWELERAVPATPVRREIPPSPPPAVPSLDHLTVLAHGRDTSRESRCRAMFSPLATAIGTGIRPRGPLETIAAAVQTAIPGHLVFNPAPFRRTDVVQLASGALRLVTDVPAVGYAFIVEDSPSPLDDESVSHPTAPSAVAEGVSHRVEIDRRSGAIRSLVSRSDGREWASSGGLNAVPGAVLEELTRESLPGVGVRFTARRRSTHLREFRSTMVVYESLPWVDIENSVDSDLAGLPQYRFAFDAPEPRVRWDIPAGHCESIGQVERMEHLRWLSLTSNLDTVFFRALDSPYASVQASGTIVSTAPPGRARYRIRVAAFPASIEDCCRFGWGAEPLEAFPVAEDPNGTLPRFGSLVVLDQPAAAILGCKRADDGNGMVVYVQELQGEPSFLSLGFGLLAFDGARRTDFLERDLDDDIFPVPDGVAFQSRPWGVTALRLLNPRFNRG